MLDYELYKISDRAIPTALDKAQQRLQTVEKKLAAAIDAGRPRGKPAGARTKRSKYQAGAIRHLKCACV